MAEHGPDLDVSALYDDGVMELELQQALKSEGEIELFKLVQKALRVRGELANSEMVRIILAGMWEDVASFFDAIYSADTLADLSHDSPIVCQHQRMLANFEVIANLNRTLKAGKEAEDELKAIDQMDHTIEDLQ